MTAEEKHLWYDFLKRLPLTVNRQKNIGNYIVDFFISSKNLIIEIDGRQHSIPEAEEADRLRDKDFEALGIRVLRYKNWDINNNFNTVCNQILEILGLTTKDIRNYK